MTTIEGLSGGAQTAEWYPAEDYHQDYYKHNAVRYKFYRHHCGRDKRLEAVWGASPPH